MLTYVLPRKIRRHLQEKSKCRKCPILDLQFGEPKDQGICNFFKGQLNFTHERGNGCVAETWGCTSKDISSMKIECKKDDLLTMPECAELMLANRDAMWKERYIVLRQYSTENYIHISDVTFNKDGG